MQIDFTKEQFEHLLKIVYLGGWIINAHRTDDQYKEYEDLENYIYSFAKQFGFEKYIDGSEEIDGRRYFPTRFFEEGTDVHKFHEDYDGETFWDELIDQMGQRDLVRDYGEEKIRKMDSDERLRLICDYEDKYAEEIDEHGIERFEVRK